MTSTTLNEYVHEDFHEAGRGEGVWICYEPLDNVPAINLMGTIFIGGRERVCFWGHRNTLIINEGHGCRPLQGSFSFRSGVIWLYWDKHPGEHFLCISYETDDDFTEEEVASVKTNWAQEGF